MRFTPPMSGRVSTFLDFVFMRLNFSSVLRHPSQPERKFRVVNCQQSAADSGSTVGDGPNPSSPYWASIFFK